MWHLLGLYGWEIDELTGHRYVPLSGSVLQPEG